MQRCSRISTHSQRLGWPGTAHSLYLSGKAASEVHGARAGFVALQPQHHLPEVSLCSGGATLDSPCDETEIRTSRVWLEREAPQAPEFRSLEPSFPKASP